jgi:hypothetical protein
MKKALRVMNHHQNHLPGYQEFIKYEGKILELLNHNVYKYRYVGEEGKEYEVIQSIFKEINCLPVLSNKHIRWYAIIIDLRMSFQNWQMTAKNRDVFADFSLPGFPGVSLHLLLDSFGEGSPKIMTHVEKSMVPSYMGLVDSYVNEIARLGMLVCTKEEISPGYLEYKWERIDSLLAELLKEMNSQKQEETREEVLVLTIKNAADNTIKLGKPPLNHGEKSCVGVNGEVYQRLISQRIQRIDEKRRADYHNMEAFWNGFIP